MFKHLLYCPFTGLGLYQGFRGNAWLRNRIQIFKQFVLPNLQAQDTDFTLWISWRPEEKKNPIVKEFQEFLKTTGLSVVHTFHGVCFWDDKYPPEQAYDRLISALHGSSQDLVNATAGAEWVYMTIQPSDDCYAIGTFRSIQRVFEESDVTAFGFTRGYVMDYRTLRVKEWNPKTNPPFYTIKFPRAVFLNPREHVEYTALKKDSGPYPKGTPLPSHEYVGDCLNYGTVEDRGFLVGTHSANISTVFDHPYTGKETGGMLKFFGLQDVGPLTLRQSLRSKLFDRLPYKAKRKLRYWAEKNLFPFNALYNFLRA